MMRRLIRHRYLVVSLAAHAVLLVLLYYFGAYQPAQDVRERRVAASARPDSHAAMRARVSDMERIKDLMRESLGEQAGHGGELRFDATSAAPDPAAMLAQAEALAREIDALGARTHAGGEPAPPGGRPAAAPDAARVQKPMAAPEADHGAAIKPDSTAPDTPAREKDAPARTRQAEAAASAPGNTASAAASAAASFGTVAGTATATPSATSAPGAGPVAPSSAATSAAAPGASAAAASAATGGGASGVSAAGAAARIAAMEQHARDVLARRQRQLEQAAGVPGSGGQGSAVHGSGAPDVAARIGAFFNRHPDGQDWAGGGYHTTGMELFHRGRGRMAHIDTAAMRKGLGRLLGAGGEFANRVYVNSWYLIGPFPGKHGAGMFANDSYPPEQAVVLDAAYRGKDGRFLTWRYVQSSAYPLVPPDAQEDSVYYGYTELMMDAERELAVWIGADDDAQVWINDQLVWKGGNINKRWFFEELYDRGIDYRTAYNYNEGKVLVRFRKGRNKLFFKLSNGPTRMFFSMVLAPA